MCGFGYGPGGGWHLFPFIFFLLAIVCVFFLCGKKRLFSANTPQDPTVPALRDELNKLRQEIEELKKERE